MIPLSKVGGCATASLLSNRLPLRRATRIKTQIGQTVEMEAEASHAAADAIFRTLFSIPIEDRVADLTYDAFRQYQRSQPILNIAAFLPLPHWMPRGFKRATRRSAAEIRTLIHDMTA